MARKKRIIQVPSENIEKLAASVGTSKGTVWNALAYRSDSANAQLIRKRAVELFGGIETTKLVM